MICWVTFLSSVVITLAVLFFLPHFSSFLHELSLISYSSSLFICHSFVSPFLPIHIFGRKTLVPSLSLPKTSLSYTSAQSRGGGCLIQWFLTGCVPRGTFSNIWRNVGCQILGDLEGRGQGCQQLFHNEEGRPLNKELPCPNVSSAEAEERWSHGKEKAGHFQLHYPNC